MTRARTTVARHLGVRSILIAADGKITSYGKVNAGLQAAPCLNHCVTTLQNRSFVRFRNIDMSVWPDQRDDLNRGID